MKNFLLINGRDKYYEYTKNSLREALDQYIVDALGFGNKFSASEYFWDKLASNLKDADDMVRLLNGFCKRDAYRIERVLTEYKLQYPISITFQSMEGFRVYFDDVEQSTSIPVHYGISDIELYIVPQKGYEISQILVDGSEVPDTAWNSDKYILTLSNAINKQVVVDVKTNKLTGDWQIVKNDATKGKLTFSDGGGDVVVSDGKDYTTKISITAYEEGQPGKDYPTVSVTKNGKEKILEETNITIISDKNSIGTNDTEAKYYFNTSDWVGTLSLPKEVLDGHIRIDAGIDTYTKDYRITYDITSSSIDTKTLSDFIKGVNILVDGQDLVDVTDNITKSHWSTVKVQITAENAGNVTDAEGNTTATGEYMVTADIRTTAGTKYAGKCSGSTTAEVDEGIVTQTTEVIIDNIISDVTISINVEYQPKQ